MVSSLPSGWAGLAASLARASLSSVSSFTKSLVQGKYTWVLGTQGHITSVDHVPAVFLWSAHQSLCLTCVPDTERPQTPPEWLLQGPPTCRSGGQPPPLCLTHQPVPEASVPSRNLPRTAPCQVSEASAFISDALLHLGSFLSLFRIQSVSLCEELFSPFRWGP